MNHSSFSMSIWREAWNSLSHVVRPSVLRALQSHVLMQKVKTFCVEVLSTFCARLFRGQRNACAFITKVIVLSGTLRFGRQVQ
jgi:hypothetical protein